jgi:hypothetical protein
MYRPETVSRPTSVLSVMCILLTIVLSACSGSSGQQPAIPASSPGPQAQGAGDIAFGIVWQRPPSRAKVLATPSFNACVDYGVGTIAATVSSGATTVASASWPCSAHGGRIPGVPAGTNYTVRIDGLSSGATPTTTWRGQVLSIAVLAGQITNAGTVVMAYIDGDIAPPTVTSITAHSSLTSTTNVPVTDRIRIAFNEPMAISTITTTNISFVNTGTSGTVSGIVSYLTASNVADFTPSANLAPNTTYALYVKSCVLASCITDLAGNQLFSDYTNTFTTEPAASGVPAAPSDLTAAPGNGQVTLDWLATGGTTSYNIYYGTAPGVSTANTQIPGVRAPAVHLGLNNGITYYYIVTAVSNSGESLASAETSATPVFPGGNPLPPANLTLAMGTGQNSISWASVTGATSYNLYWSPRSITPDKYSADRVVRNVTSPFTHTGLVDGLSYCYIVTAMNANGESADSMQVCSGAGSIQIVW